MPSSPTELHLREQEVAVLRETNRALVALVASQAKELALVTQRCDLIEQRMRRIEESKAARE